MRHVRETNRALRLRASTSSASRAPSLKRRAWQLEPYDPRFLGIVRACKCRRSRAEDSHRARTTHACMPSSRTPASWISEGRPRGTRGWEARSRLYRNPTTIVCGPDQRTLYVIIWSVAPWAAPTRLVSRSPVLQPLFTFPEPLHPWLHVYFPSCARFVRTILDPS